MANHCRSVINTVRWSALTLAAAAALVLPGIILSTDSTHAQTSLRVGVYDNPPKVELTDNGSMGGILGELLLAIAERENWQITAVPCEWNACLQLLESGAIDIMPDVALTETREQQFNFHAVPALLSWSQIYTTRGRPISSLLGLDGMRVSVLADSVQSHYLAELADDFGLAVTLIEVNSFDDAFQAVADGRAEAAATNHFFGDLKAIELGLMSSPVLFEPSQLFYAAPSGQHNSALARIDEHLTLWQHDTGSVYFDILSRWLPDRTRTHIPGWLWWIAAALVSALLLAMLLNHLLGRKVAERTASLRNSEQRLATILNSVDAYIYIKDADLRYTYVNRRVIDLLGLPEDRIIGHTDEDFFDARTCAQLRLNDERVLSHGERFANEENNTVHSSGETVTVLSVKLPLTDEHGTVYALCGISTDITEHRRIQRELHQLAFFDPITGLANRRLLIDRLEHALASRNSTGFEGALLMLDIDNFKSINDSRGHSVGDEVLRQVATRLKQNLRSTDTVARLSADEFVVLMEDLNQNQEQAIMQARDYAALLNQLLSTSLRLQGDNYTPSVSIGIAMFSDAHDSVDDMLKDCDLALAAAKQRGRGAISFFNPQMQTDVNRRINLESSLREALHGNLLELHVQPQVDSQGTVFGVEGLLRWHDETLGDVPPSEFIPVAESSGLIHELGRFVLRQAASTLQRWSAIPNLQGLTLSINISPVQFRHSEFVNELELCLHHYQIDPGRLELEITEGLLIDNPDETANRMLYMKDQGVHFSLDDFGTGYASLGYLKSLPLQQLKIDQSFVRDILTDPNDEAIIRTILALGESLDLEVIAEGVENQEQAEWLNALGCRKFQGYFYGRPGPISEWERRLTHSPA